MCDSDAQKPLTCQHWAVQPDPAVHPDWQHLAQQVVAEDGTIICRVSDANPAVVARMIALAPVMRDLLLQIAQSRGEFSNAAYTVLCSIPLTEIDPDGYAYLLDGEMLTSLFWRCACAEDNIHPHTQPYCHKCSEWFVWSDDMPVDEVLRRRAELPEKLVQMIEGALAAQSQSS